MRLYTRNEQTNRPALVGASLAAVGSLLAVVADSIGDARWLLAALCGVGAVQLGRKGRELAEAGAPHSQLATAAIDLGGILSLGVVVWLVLYLI